MSQVLAGESKQDASGAEDIRSSKGRLELYHPIVNELLGGKLIPVPGESFSCLGPIDLLFPGTPADMLACFGVYQYEHHYLSQVLSFNPVVRYEDGTEIYAVLSIVPDDNMPKKNHDVRHLVWRFIKNQGKAIGEKMCIYIIVHGTPDGGKEILIASAIRP